MDFKTAVATCFRKCATFSGRAKRPEFWWFALFVVLGNIVLGIVDAMILEARPVARRSGTWVDLRSGSADPQYHGGGAAAA